MTNLPKYIEFARELIKNQTPEEEKLWNYLRNRKLSGFKFLRQHPILLSGYIGYQGFYIADFYCAERKLVVEIDGLIHTLQVDYDKARDIIMNEMSLTVFRIANEEVQRNVYAVLKKIEAYLNH